jgi:predicted RNase H-like HicB family nuclease
MSAPQTFTAAVHREEDWYVAQCLEVDVASQGRTIDEALANLAEAAALYLEEVDDPAQYVTSTPLVTLCRSKIGSWAVNCAISDVKRLARTR